MYKEIRNQGTGITEWIHLSLQDKPHMNYTTWLIIPYMCRLKYTVTQAFFIHKLPTTLKTWKWYTWRVHIYMLKIPHCQIQYEIETNNN